MDALTGSPLVHNWGRFGLPNSPNPGTRFPLHLVRDDCQVQTAPTFPLILSLSKDVTPSGAWFDKPAGRTRRRVLPFLYSYNPTARTINSTLDGSGFKEPSSMPCMVSTMASWNGVGTPVSRPLLQIRPFIKSTSEWRPL